VRTGAYTRVEHPYHKIQPYPQTSDYAGKACMRQIL
jgi:hypothetical protein